MATQHTNDNTRQRIYTSLARRAHPGAVVDPIITDGNRLYCRIDGVGQCVIFGGGTILRVQRAQGFDL